MSGHMQMCAASSPRYVWEQGNLCSIFTSLSGHKEICASQSRLCLGIRKCVLHLLVVMSGHVEILNATTQSCHPLLQAVLMFGHYPSSWFDFTTTFLKLSFFFQAEKEEKDYLLSPFEKASLCH
jgi:hypothetical protein